MKKFNTIFLLLFLLMAAIGSPLKAQDTRYVDPIFSDVSVETDVVYGTNVSILTGAPAALNLLMDVYTPEGDDVTDRPVVIYFHTGSFLPQYFNGQITGSRKDSTVVEICTRLAQRGYVAIAATYRQGWRPTADDQNVRTSTLLQAAYRGIQDARTAIRFLRKSVAEDDNPYGIDPEKIVLWGQGTGGYISLGAAFLDDYEELLLDKFIDTETLLPYIDTTLHGNLYATNETPLNNPNHVDYSSDFALSINVGGALGDISWMDGSEDEPAVVGYHVVSDPFAPFADGPVIVPTTQEFVVNVSGTRTVVERANELGINDILEPANQAPTELNAIVDVYENVTVDLSALGGPASITLAVDNMYPFVLPGLASGPWDWWNKPRLDAEIAFINGALGTNFNADQLHSDGLLTNPDMSPEKARAYIDTVMTYFYPRACQALALESCAIVGTEDLIDARQVDLKISPNPSNSEMWLETNHESLMKDVFLFDLSGRLLDVYSNVNANKYRLEKGSLSPGMYILKLRFEEGIVTKKIVFN